MQAIVAMSENRAIGLNGGLPWPKNAADLKWFKSFTIGKKILVGYNTYKKLPILKDRTIYVLGKENSALAICQIGTMFHMIKSINQAPKDCIIAGGAKTYQLLLPKITEFFVTKIKGNYEADTFMPDFEHLFARREKWAILEDNKTEVWKYSKN